MGFPHQERLMWIVQSVLSAGRRRAQAFKARRQSRIDLIIPAAPDAPASLALLVHDFAADLVGGTRFPAALFEVKGADFAGVPVLDLHGPVVVDCGVASDDTNNGAGDFLPGVEFRRTSGDGT